MSLTAGQIGAVAVLVDAVAADFGGTGVDGRIVVVAVVAAAGSILVTVEIRVRATRRPIADLEGGRRRFTVSAAGVEPNLDQPCSDLGVLPQGGGRGEDSVSLKIELRPELSFVVAVRNRHARTSGRGHRRSVAVGGDHLDGDRVAGRIGWRIRRNTQVETIGGADLADATEGCDGDRSRENTHPQSNSRHVHVALRMFSAASECRSNNDRRVARLASGSGPPFYRLLTNRT